MQPKTYLLCAPDAEDPLGRGMPWQTLLAGLRRCNPNIVMPVPEQFPSWYPGKEFQMTCAWLGAPSAPGSLKLFALKLGVLPEYTQLGPDGKIIAMGWRALLSKSVACGAVTQRDVEREFNVSLAYEGTDTLCPTCRRFGNRITSDSASGLCGFHEHLAKKKALKASIRSEVQYLMRRYG